MPKVTALETLFKPPQKRKGKGRGPLSAITVDGTKNCPYCGRLMDRNGPERLRPTRDHFLPRSRGHALRGPNKVICCRECNCRKSDLSILDWMRKLRRSQEPLDRVRLARLNHFVEHRQRKGLPLDDSEEIVTTC